MTVRHHPAANSLVLIFLLKLLLLQQPLPSVDCSREVDERFSKFLFAADPNAKSLVSEYQLHMAPEEDFQEEALEDHEYDHKIGDVSDYESTKHIRPYFLSNKVFNPRVVVFYSPWSGGSIDFKPRFIELAREIKRRRKRMSPGDFDPGAAGGAEEEGDGGRDDDWDVEFHAISCSAHMWVCHNENIKTYPSVKAYRSQSTEGSMLKWFTADFVSVALGIELNEDTEQADGSSSTAAGEGETSSLVTGFGDDEYLDRPNFDILGASLDGHTRTKSDLYDDAALSFIHALRLDIYSSEGVELSKEQKSAFVEWVDLLYWTLPPTWKLHTLIQDLRTNIDMALSNRANLVRFIEQHSDVVLEGRTRWTQSCSHGRDSEGYACGMWALLHICSVGVAERHTAVLGGRERATTAHAALTVRNYVQHFFQYVCGHQCQSDFMAMYDKCGFHHCKRFKQITKKNTKPKEESWKEFALWMHEVHNDVTLRLISAEAALHGRKRLTFEEEEAAIWPSTHSCRLCYDGKGKWNRDNVFNYLRTEYWPGGIHNWRFVVLDKNEYASAPRPKFRVERWTLIRAGMIVAAAFLVADIARQRYLLRTGRYKKFDHHDHYV